MPQVDGTEARKAEELCGCYSVPLGGTFEVVKLFIGGIANDTRLWMSLGCRQNNLCEAREVDLIVVIRRGEQPHLERTMEPWNPGQALDDPQVWSDGEHGLIDIFRLRIVKDHGIRPKVVSFQNASERIGHTDDDCRLLDFLLERREPMHRRIPAGDFRDLAHLLR